MKPNFFIVGAVKAGTTALSEYLREHPKVFISDPKEIHFFADDLPRYRYVEELRDYLDIFSKASSEHLAIGEASVYHLYSSVAVENIRKFNPDAKIIVMLRNPVELAHSQHSEMLFNCNEDVEDFVKAWHLQDIRKQGLMIPRGCRDAKVLFYRDIALLGEQVERLLRIFPRRQVHFVWQEKLRADPRQAYLGVLNFLGVPDDERKNFERINANKVVLYPWLARLSQTPPLWIVKSVRWMRLRLGIGTGWIVQPVRRWNSVTAERPALPESFVRELQEEFSGDIKKLALLTGRNLEHWMSSPEAG